MYVPTVMDPQTITLTGWPMSEGLQKFLRLRPSSPDRIQMALMATHSPNLQAGTLVNFAAFILRELGNKVGLERASEIIFQMAQTMNVGPSGIRDPRNTDEFEGYTPFNCDGTNDDYDDGFDSTGSH